MPRRKLSPEPEDAIDDGMPPPEPEDALPPAPPPRPEDALPPGPPPEPDDETPPEPTLRERLAGMGLREFGSLDSDEAAERYLADAYAVARDSRTQLQEYLTHRGEFQEFLARQKAPPPVPPDAGGAQGFWKPPEYDPAWADAVEFDEATGSYRHKLNVGTPEIAAKLNAYERWLRSENQRFWQKGPHEYLRPAVEQMAEQVAQRIVEDRLAQRELAAAQQQFYFEHAPWMAAQRDGQPVADPATGQPMLTDRGLAFRASLQRAREQYGVTDEALALQLALELMGGPPPPQEKTTTPSVQRDASNLGTLRQAATRRRNRAGTISRDPANGAAPAQDDGLSLKEKMRKALVGGGFTDADLRTPD